jgi:hypothetical protein
MCVQKKMKNKKPEKTAYKEFHICTLHQYLGDQIKEKAEHVACTGKIRNRLLGRPRCRGVDTEIKQNIRMWAGFIWLNGRSNDGLL